LGNVSDADIAGNGYFEPRKDGRDAKQA